MTEKEKFMEYAKKRLKEKTSKKKLLENDLISASVRAMEKNRKKRIGQVQGR